MYTLASSVDTTQKSKCNYVRHLNKKIKCGTNVAKRILISQIMFLVSANTNLNVAPVNPIVAKDNLNIATKCTNDELSMDNAFVKTRTK